MSKNPVVPYILIFALGIGLIFFMSLYGLDQKKEIANQSEDGKTEEGAAVEDFDAEAVAQGKCIGCHGGDLTGGMGGAAPSLVGTSLSKEDIHNVIKNGQGNMPPQGITDDVELDALADYILSLK
ncbi:cytochrome c550 [Sporosarcina limicola]|uniref:Cytochrome c550 n=1 Tax=Sporosarcina limicola TaxID=34101 RepID=A0A927R3G2_9BACL|nr:cytochrome c [Sporosarcina limicola]MBE1553728.1 cytochrome c550 [Sporosarcina limicola]